MNQPPLDGMQQQIVGWHLKAQRACYLVRGCVRAGGLIDEWVTGEPKPADEIVWGFLP